MSQRRPTKRHSLQKIVDLKVPVGTVIDVGILTGTHDILHVYKATKQILIEPIVEWNETIIKIYTEAGVDFELINAAASDSDGKMMMETSSVRPGKPITHARLTEKNSRAKPEGSSGFQARYNRLCTPPSEASVSSETGCGWGRDTDS